MSHSKSSTAIKKKEEEEQKPYSAEIIPWPDMESVLARKKRPRKKEFILRKNTFFTREKKFPSFNSRNPDMTNY